MNKEIEEILDDLEFVSSLDNNVSVKLNKDKVKKLRDYITNLQEENKELLDKVRDREKLIVENIQLKRDRIDKAIEHLKESIDNYLKDDRDIIDGTCNVLCVETIKKRYLKPVLDILEGKEVKDE